jgi:hypothetical protein
MTEVKVTERKGPGRAALSRDEKLLVGRIEAAGFAICTEISTWEKLLDLCREFSLVPIRNYGYGAPPNVNRF